MTNTNTNADKSDVEEMFRAFKRSRVTLIEVHKTMEEGPDKEAVGYYIKFGSGIDTATVDTIVDVVSEIILTSEGDPIYQYALQVLAGIRSH